MNMIKKLLIFIGILFLYSSIYIFSSTASVLNLHGNIPLTMEINIAHIDSSSWSGSITKDLNLIAEHEWQDIARLREITNYRFRVIVNTANNFTIIGDNHAYELGYQLRVTKIDGLGGNNPVILSQNGDSYDRDFMGLGGTRTFVRMLEILYDAQGASLVPDTYRDTVTFTISAY